MYEPAMAEQNADNDIPLRDYLRERPKLVLKMLYLAESLPGIDDDPVNDSRK